MNISSDWWLALLFPIIGALIGWLTNRLAIKMLFYPRRPRRVLGFTLQGLIPRRKEELAIKVGEIVETELLNQHLIRNELRKMNLRPHLEHLAMRIIRQRLVPKLKQIPLFGGFVNENAIRALHRVVLQALTEETQSLLEKVSADVEQHIAVRHIVETRVRGFDLDQLENIIRDLAHREFRAIEWLGGLIGFLVGIIQAVLLLVV